MGRLLEWDDGTQLRRLLNSVEGQVKYKPNNTSRINSLPDELLANILSFLPTKEAVATSVLSKRWSLIHTLITKLDFDDSPISYCVYHPCNTDRSSSFRMFVDNVLRKWQSRDNASITSFRLKFGKGKSTCRDDFFCASKCYPVLHPTHLKTWMCFPLSRGVTQLDLCTRSRNPGELPFALFRCQTLQVLKLEVNHELRLPKSVWLPRLKVLHLTLARIPAGNFITRLLSNCQLLEDFLLLGVWEASYPIHIISAPSLRRLSVGILDNPDDIIDVWRRSVFVLDAPRLEYLAYEDYLAIEYSVGDMNSLAEANIDTHVNREVSSCEVILDLLRPLFNVQCLHLWEGCMMAMERSRLEHNKLPMFRNLKQLELTFGSSKSCEVLLDLLDVSPFLQTLVLWEFCTNPLDDYEGKSLNTTETTPSCLEFYLKRIEMKDFQEFEVEQALIKYFLTRGLVLEELVIVCMSSMPMADRMSLYNKLQEMPKRSMTCLINVQ